MKPLNFILATCIVLIFIASSVLVIKSGNADFSKLLLNYEKGCSYEDVWEKVAEFEKKGLTKSALEVVEAIYNQAKTDKNYPQIVKALIYKQKYRMVLEENAYQNMVNELTLEIDSATFPLKQMLQSVLADVYWSYYQYYRWQIYYRSETVGYNPEDINTWDAVKILEQCHKLHLSSLSNPDSSKALNIDYYDNILVKQPGSKKYRPTLYDFLAHRAFDFLTHAEAEINKPASFFDFSKEEYLYPSYDFVNQQIVAEDTMSYKYHAMLILKELENFHLNDSTPEALIDVFIKRINFVYSNSHLPENDSLYLLHIEEMQKRYADYDASAELSYLIASFYENQAKKYKPLISDKYKWDNKKAIEIAESVIKKYPDSFGALNCKNLIKRIKNKAATFDIESYNNVNKPFKAFLSYKNIDKLNFKIVKIDWTKYHNDVFNLYGEDLYKYMQKLKPVKEFTADLMLDGDYQTHNTEIVMPALDNGCYLILAYWDDDFQSDSTEIIYAYTQITNIAYIYRKNPNDDYDVVITNRETGKPLKGAKTILWEIKYDYIFQKYKLARVKTYTSDDNGIINIPAVSEHGSSYYLEFEYGNDNAYCDEYIYQYMPYNYDEPRYVTYFFTDREIYRPGQTIYFKGIVLKKTGDKHEIVKDYATVVCLYDANYQVVGQLTLMTNEFGTFSGSFTAPMGVLTGQMRLNNSIGSKYFYVEEYKRPKFEVSFQPVKTGFKLFQEVKLTGEAIAYSGAKIDGAEVKYEIKRNVYYPDRWSWYYWYYPQPDAVTVSSGICKTDVNGEFIISFLAEPDNSIDNKLKPVYTYTITADVTDINGETRSVTKSINIGYNALMINTNWNETVNILETKFINLETTNMSGEFIPAKGTLMIYKLKENKKLFRSRLWTEPDIKTMSKEEYYKQFPYDYYSDEYDISKLEKEKLVFERSFDTEKSKEIILSEMKKWKQGIYKIEVQSKDEFGTAMDYEQYVKIYNPQLKDVAVNDLEWLAVINNKCEPGEKASFLIGSADTNVFVLYEIEHKEKIIKREWMTINNEQKTIEIPVTENFRGNFSVHFMMVKHGRTFYHNELVTVPYSNKELDISFETFRNKLYPGEDEEWKIKIKGPKGEKVAAEMLATLYDASLDQFKPNNWYFDIYKNYYSTLNWYESNSFISKSSSLLQLYYENYFYQNYHYYDALNWFGFYYVPDYYDIYGLDNTLVRGDYTMDDEVVLEESEDFDGKMKVAEKSVMSKTLTDAPAPPAGTAANREISQSQIASGERRSADKNDGIFDVSGQINMENVKIRKNFNETAFFYPHLQTNENGEVIIKFKIPEALTKWKMLGFAHTKDLMYGLIEKELITQKDLMVVPNLPRFFRENDRIVINAKIVNLSDKKQSGYAQIEFYDAVTMKPVTNLFGIDGKPIAFNVDENKSSVVSWELLIPEDVKAVSCRIVAKTSKFSDGEENIIPILTNRMLVTESIPLPVRGNETKTFSFKKLLNSGSSSTLKHEKYTLEFTSNPAWYAVQSLPYLIEYPYECAEQIFSRYYANSLASHIANSNPKIKQVFDSWKNTKGSDALLSNLGKNQELKSLLLEETPWVLNAQDENERKRRVGLLFDLNHMANNINSAKRKLENLQCSNGGWVWFKGGPDDRYITQHIITGFGHLDHLGVTDVKSDNKIWNMVYKGIGYLDNEIRKDYNWLKKNLNEKEMEEDNIGYYQIQYLYARSFFKDVPVPNSSQEAFDYYITQAKKYWINKNRYMQGMIALALYRNNDKTTSTDIIKSLAENAIVSEEMGMYWKENNLGYYWYEAPIETQALLIEAFDEIAKDTKKVDDLRVWLLKQKQTQDWKTTKATTEAIYALLLRGTDWLATESNVSIWIADQLIDKNTHPEIKAEAGTGYFKISWPGDKIKPEMGEIKVEKHDEGVSWGAVYWQYFEQLDKITPHETPLKINKKLFKQVQTDKGKVLKLINDNDKINVGDKVIVRIEIKVDRRMEYVHMKDMRGSCFEPINVISQYKYQDGLGYYESTKDASTNFFFTVLNKGTYVFEYPLWVAHSGDFSNGITTIQCMYAPEFTSHSEGIRVKVE
ncbi:MAG: alpha-2-macroglobulin family protein [Marinilabiliales bacterium]